VAFHYDDVRLLDPHKSLDSLGHPQIKTSKDMLKNTSIEYEQTTMNQCKKTPDEESFLCQVIYMKYLNIIAK
jgi:hypothetical protein